MRDVLRAAVKTGSGSGVSMIMGAIASKIISVVLGPTGLGLFSMLVQVQQTASTAGTMGGASALVQGLANKKGEPRELYVVSVFWIFLIGGLAISLVLVLLAPWLAPVVTGDRTAETVGLVRWLALPTFLAVMVTYVNGVLNGFRAIGRLAAVQAAGAAILALLAFPLSEAVDTGYSVALVALLTAQVAASLVLSTTFAAREGWLSPLRRSAQRVFIDRPAARHFFSIALVMLVTGTISTLVLLVVRSLIVQSQELEGAGIFNVAWTLGMVYPMLALSSFGTYYLPTLCMTSDSKAKAELMGRVFRATTLVMAPLILLALALCPLVIDILYTSDFYPSLATVRWMLIGDYVKAASWVFAMPLLAYADMKTYLWTEVLWYVGFLGCASASVTAYGSIEGIGLSFAGLYVCYLAYVVHYSRSRHGFTPGRFMTAWWTVGLGAVLVWSYMTWGDTVVQWLLIPILLAVIVVYCAFIPTAQERASVLRFLRIG